MFNIQPGMGLGSTGSKQIALGLGDIGAGGTPPQLPTNDLVLGLVSELTWPLVVELHGNEQKRRDYD